MQTYTKNGFTRHEWVRLYQTCAALRLQANLRGNVLLSFFCTWLMSQFHAMIKGHLLTSKPVNQ
ncbi:hypothetical protein [Fibrella aquatica]|uniref:hypothetical protein n=1 Tax=Fibrella aquatica TaxID=3242487 RepID=UPI00351F952A